VTAAPRPRTKPTAETLGGVYSQTGPHAFIPLWVLDPATYLPGVPNPAKLRKGDDKPLNNAELRTLIALRSFADRYSGHAFPLIKTIAARAGVHPTSAEKAVSKFKRLGWVTSKRRYRDPEKRIIAGCDYYVIDVCPQPRLTEDSPSDADPDQGVPANSRGGGYPPNDGEGTRESEGASNTPREHPNNQRNEVNWRTADASREQEDDLPLAFDGHPARRVFEDWPAQDWDLFRSHIGADHIHSDGSRWAKGTHTTRALYLGFRQRGQNPVRWPGRYLDETSSTNGVEYVLDDQGITPAQPEETP
jgi:hypothetical protein